LTGFADGAHNGYRMNVAIALTAAMYGATVVNHAEVNELVKDPATGRITGVRVKDLLSGKSGDDFLVRAKVHYLSLPPPSPSPTRLGNLSFHTDHEGLIN